MSMNRSVYRGCVLLIAIAMVPRGGSAQEGEMLVRVTPTAGQCSADSYVVGYIGYKDLECNCSFSIGPDGPQRFEFRAEPVIGGIDPGSPADGSLRAGDIITAIDGQLITTREGGRRFARLAPGEPVTLTVRRRDREMDVTLVPEQACYEVASLPPPRVPSPPERTNATPRPRPVSAAPSLPRRAVSAPAPPRRPTITEAVPLRPTTPVPPPPPDASSGWVGLSIQCAECQVGDDDGVVVWIFSSPPEVDRVEAHSAAHRAGIRAGDRLTHINGLPITSDEGGRLFGAVEPGDTVTFRYTRNNSILESEIVAATRIQYGSRIISGWNYYRADTVPPPTQPVTRFSGVIGDAHVLVTGGPVSVNRTDDELVIQAGDVTIRVKRTGSTEDGIRH